MEISAIYNLNLQGYIIPVSFVFLALVCLLNYYIRQSSSWLFASFLYLALAGNVIWHFNLIFGNWLVSEKSQWLAPIDEILPGFLINQTISVWVIFAFCLLLFLTVIILLAQIRYRKLAFLFGTAGLLIYIFDFSWWIYWILTRGEVLSRDIIMGVKDILLIFGNLLLLVSLSLSLRKE